MSERARQFLAFDAVKGFKEAIKEKEKIIVPKITLSDEQIEEISNILLKVEKNMIIELTYFNKGEYIKIKGMVANIDKVLKKIIIVKTKIDFEDIYKIDLIETKVS